MARRPWGSLVSFDTNEILWDWVREFYSDMEVVSSEISKTYVRGKWIDASRLLLGNFWIYLC